VKPTWTPTRPQWIFFDLDDTLVNSSAAYTRALAEVGIDSKSPEWAHARFTVKDLLGDQSPAARNRLLYFKIFTEAHVQFSPDAVLKLMKTYEEALYQDLKEQWQSLSRNHLFFELSQKFNLGIITNENTRTQLIKMSALDPNSQYFKFILTSEEVGVEKPHPKIFTLALSRAKVPTSKCVMIGDSIENDIVPTEQIGMGAFHTIEFLDQKTSSCLRVLQSLEEILNHFP